MTVAITGASGHVGGNLVRELLSRGVRPRVLVHKDGRALEGLDVEVFRGNVLDRKSLDPFLDGAELVYHLAARISIVPGEAAEVQRINVDGVRNVVDACLAHKVDRLVHFSSIHALSSTPVEQPIDETRPLCSGDDLLPYDRSKAGGEREIAAGVQKGLDAVTVNPTAVIGPHDYRPSRMGEVFLQLYRRELPGLVDGGFNWVDVRDIVDGAIKAGEKGRTGERYLLAGERRTVAELAKLVEEVTGKRAPMFVSPMWLARGVAPFATAVAKMTKKEPLFTSQSLQALRNHIDIKHDKASRELGYQARPLKDTLRDTFAWFGEANRL